MSDVVLAALFSSAGAALVAVAGAVASIFGPAWRDRDQRRHEEERARQDVRFARALELVEKVCALPAAEFFYQTREVFDSRAQFIATLRAGKGPVEAFTMRMIELARRNTPNQAAQLTELSREGDRLFAYLRGEITATALLEEASAAPNDD